MNANERQPLLFDELGLKSEDSRTPSICLSQVFRRSREARVLFGGEARQKTTIRSLCERRHLRMRFTSSQL